MDTRLLLIALALLALAACTPTTPYRYTAVIPAAHALTWDGRTAKDGSLRVEGAMTQTTVSRNLVPHVHDTAVRVPNTTLEASGMLVLVPGFEIGARYTYAAYTWTEPSAEGTLPLPSHPSVWGLGPELHGSFPLGRRWALGIGGNLMRYNVPYAEWQLASCAPSALCVTDPATVDNASYQLFDERAETHWVFNLAVYPSLALGENGEYGRVFGGLSAHTAFKNDGFTDKAQNGSTLEDAGLVYFVAAGYSLELSPMHLAAMMSLPLTSTSSPVNYGVGGFFALGVDLELWESRDDRKRAAPPME